MVGGMNTTPPQQRTVTYFRPAGSDGWRVQCDQGVTIVSRLAVGTKDEAIAAVRQILADMPGTQFVLADLGEVWAWREGEQWLYSPEPQDEACTARLLDDMGSLVLQVQETGHTIFAPNPKRFHHGDGGCKYAGPPNLTDEELRHYKEIGDRIEERLKQQTKGRRSRWQPRD
jgi:hypothetical protein